MSGISSPIPISRAGPLLEIAILGDTYNIGPKIFERTATDKELELFTDEVLDAFGKIEQAIKSAKSVTLPPQLCQQQLSKLAGPGMAAYRRFFRNDRARQILAHRL